MAEGVGKAGEPKIRQASNRRRSIAVRLSSPDIRESRPSQESFLLSRIFHVPARRNRAEIIELLEAGVLGRRFGIMSAMRKTRGCERPEPRAHNGIHCVQVAMAHGVIKYLIFFLDGDESWW